jgi:L-rhamnose mutarotase
MTLILKDDDEIVERYKEYHRHAWPEVLARLSLFLPSL